MIFERVTCLSLSYPNWIVETPSLAQFIKQGITFNSPVTFLVGPNGSGKSTIIEAIAEAYGLDAQGGRAGRKYGNDRPKTPLGEGCQLHFTREGSRISAVKRNRKGYFLRAETAYGFMTFVQGMPGYWEDDITKMSHGEGFLTVLETMFNHQGLYLLDEPESALSFDSCLRLLSIIRHIVSIGGQVICATHSPLLSAYPHAQLLSLGEHGIESCAWKELPLVDQWRRFYHDPSLYLSYLTED